MLNAYKEVIYPCFVIFVHVSDQLALYHIINTNYHQICIQKISFYIGGIRSHKRFLIQMAFSFHFLQNQSSRIQSCLIGTVLKIFKCFATKLGKYSRTFRFFFIYLRCSDVIRYRCSQMQKYIYANTKCAFGSLSLIYTPSMHIESFDVYMYF